MASAAASPHRLNPPPPQVVQAYFAPLSLAAPGVPNHPIKALWGFERVSDLGSGESATVTFSLGARDLQLSDLNGDLVLGIGLCIPPLRTIRSVFSGENALWSGVSK